MLDTTRHLAVPHGTLAYDDRGSGPLVVMAPGLGDLRRSYRFMAPLVAERGYRVVTVDLRGHGDSSAVWPSYTSEDVGNDLLALVAELDGGPAVLVGNSFAAGAAVWAAAERPEAVAGVALIGPFVRDHDTSPVMRLLQRVLFSGPWKVAAWQMFHATLFPGAKPADHAAYGAALRANLAEPGRFAALKAMMAGSKASVEARLARVSAPGLVLMGDRDPDFPDPAEEANWIAQQLKGEAHLLPGLGHYPQAEAPEPTAAALVEFMERIGHRG